MFTPEEQKRTIWAIFQHKFYDYLENETVSDLLWKIFLIIAAFLITIILTYPDQGIYYFKKIFMFENMIIPKAFVIFYITYNIKILSKQYQLTVKKMKINFPKKSDRSNIKDEDLISWIPIVEILDHLFTNKHFKRTEIESKFSIPRNKYQELAEKMESINILKRGENNSRVLNEDFTREQIARAFVFAEGDVKKLYMPVQETESGFTRNPLLPSLTDKYSNLTDMNATA